MLMFLLLTLEHVVEEPDDEAVGQKQNHRSKQWPVKNQSVPDMSYFERNQRTGGEDHQELRPAFLHVNADPFGKKDRAIKKSEDPSRAQRAAGEGSLQFVEKKNDVLAVMQQQLIVRPI